VRAEEADEWRRSIGARVRDRREAHGWTGQRLADEAGLKDKGRVSLLESGRQIPEEESLRRVAAALGVSVAWLRYGVTSSSDEERIRIESYAAGWRAALDQAAAALAELRVAPPHATADHARPTEAEQLARDLDEAEGRDPTPTGVVRRRRKPGSGRASG
jgi:transcriptional regulator with XRE-family HTH domain